MPTLDLGKVVGPKGEKGDPFTYEDFTPEQLATLVGQEGRPGAVGPSGADGKDGITPHIENGNWFIGDEDTGVKAAGADGKDGVEGAPGSPGKDGADGITPHIGDNGNWFIGDEDTGVSAGGSGGGGTGADGITPHIGDNGNWFIGDEDTGVNAEGKDGVGIASASQTTTSSADGGSNVFTFTMTDGTTKTFTVKNGSKGSKGSTGSTGSKGADGYTPTIAVATNTATEYKLKITNKSGTITTPNLQAVSFVEDAKVYSTSEKVVGTWVDGKPLYQKTLVTTAPAVSTDGTYANRSVSIGCTTIDVAPYVQGVLVMDGNYYPITHVGTLAENRVIRAIVVPASGKIEIWSNFKNWNNLPMYITVRYTKTTDTATASMAMLIDEYDEGVNEA